MEDKGRVAVITGAASGIGFALALHCLDEFSHVIFIDANEEALTDCIKNLPIQARPKSLGVLCDVRNPDDVNDMVSQLVVRFKRIDLVINNAGISGSLKPLWELSLAHINDVLDVNIRGMVHVLHAFLPVLIQQSHRSHVVNMASCYALLSGSRIAPYAMSKHAILALSESLFFDLQRENYPVDVSVVCPSFVNTNLLKHSISYEYNDIHQQMEKLLKRSRSAKEVAEIIMEGINKNQFYILPDKEIKNYCADRTAAILEQTKPDEHGLEKMMNVLIKRVKKSSN